MAGLTRCPLSSSITALSNPTPKSLRLNHPLLCPNPLNLIYASPTIPITSLSLSRSSISQMQAVSTKRSYHLFAACQLVDGNSETYPEAESRNSDAGVTIDIKLPRRSLLVQFTCDKCGQRTDRLINRLAYERGLVYVQCAGCEQYHKLADNLGLVVEHDLREEINAEPNTDHV